VTLGAAIMAAGVRPGCQVSSVDHRWASRAKNTGHGLP
jgi:hypothetical protein